jgi:hypothetical protein
MKRKLTRALALTFAIAALATVVGTKPSHTGGGNGCYIGRLVIYCV